MMTASPTKKSLPQLSKNGQGALEAIKELGFRVVPGCWPVNGKCGCGHFPPHEGHDIGKAPMYVKGIIEHGLKDATETGTGVKDFWGRFPQANVLGVVPHNRLVLDVDLVAGGYESLGRLQQDHDALPDTRCNVTGGGGQHLIYNSPTTIGCRPILTQLGYQGLDVKGSGGYIVLPPSLHASGNRYTVSPVWDGPVTPAPEWLIKLLTTTLYPVATIEIRTRATHTARQ